MNYELALVGYGALSFALGMVFAFALFYKMAKIGRGLDDKEETGTSRSKNA